MPVYKTVEATKGTVEAEIVGVVAVAEAEEEISAVVRISRKNAVPLPSFFGALLDKRMMFNHYKLNSGKSSEFEKLWIHSG